MIVLADGQFNLVAGDGAAMARQPRGNGAKSCGCGGDAISLGPQGRECANGEPNQAGVGVSNAGTDPQAQQPATTDGALVGATLRGDRAAFDVLVQRHQRQATAVAFRLLSNVDDALEVVQESFLRAYRDLSKLRQPERFAGWLCGIVRHTAHRARREL